MTKVGTGMGVALLLAACTPAEISAADFTWTGGNGGSNWMTAANPPWNPAPGAGDFADTNKTFLLGTASDIAKANGGTFSAPLTIGSNTKLQLSASSTASNLVLNGGYVSMFDRNSYTL